MTAGSEQTILVRRRLLWWSAQWAEQPLGTIDHPTTLRARTREGVIEKWRKRLNQRDGWESVRIPVRIETRHD